MRLWWVVGWLVQVGSRHPIHGDPARVSLVIDSKFLAVDSYKSQVRSTGLEGSLPFFEEKPWIISGRDLNVGWNAHGAHVPGY